MYSERCAMESSLTGQNADQISGLNRYFHLYKVSKQMIFHATLLRMLFHKLPQKTSRKREDFEQKKDMIQHRKAGKGMVKG